MIPPMAGIKAMAKDKGFPEPKALRAEVKKFPYVYVSMTLCDQGKGRRGGNQIN